MGTTGIGIVEHGHPWLVSDSGKHCIDLPQKQSVNPEEEYTMDILSWSIARAMLLPPASAR
jgi:hypothetical protein